MTSDLKALLARVPQVGSVQWIGVRPDRDVPMLELTEVFAIEDRGLEGDRCSRRRGGKRQVTLVQAEHLPVVAALLGREAVPPATLRRNVVVAGIPLRALKGLRFQLGDAILVGDAECAPCAKMERSLGDGAFAALRGHGGILASVAASGRVRLGDEVRALGPER